MPKVQRARQGGKKAAARAARAAHHPYHPAKKGQGAAAAATFYGSDAVEADPKRLAKRQKQVDYGKNTIGYTRYLALVPRARRTRDMPRTPNIRKKMSKRAFVGLVAQWRRQLHEYDPKDGEEGGGDGSENVGVLEDQRRAEAEAMARQQQQQQQQRQFMAMQSANASTPGGASTATTAATTTTSTAAATAATKAKTSSEFDEFDDMDDLSQSMEEYGLTRAQILEAARDDPEFMDLLRNRERASSGMGASSPSAPKTSATSTAASTAAGNPIVADVNFEESDEEDFNFEDDELL